MPQRLKSGTCQYSRLITHPPRERMKESFVGVEQGRFKSDFVVGFYSKETFSRVLVEQHVRAFFGEKLFQPRVEKVKIRRDGTLDPDYVSMMENSISHWRKKGDDNAVSRFESELNGARNVVKLITASSTDLSPLPVVVNASDPGDFYVDDFGKKKSVTHIWMKTSDQNEGWEYNVYSLPTSHLGLENHWKVLEELADIQTTTAILAKTLNELTPENLIAFPVILNHFNDSLDLLASRLGYKNWTEVEERAAHQLELSEDKEAEKRRERIIDNFTARIFLAVKSGKSEEYQEALVSAMSDTMAIEAGKSDYIGMSADEISVEIEKNFKVALALKSKVFENKNYEEIRRMKLNLGDLSHVYAHYLRMQKAFENPLVQEARSTGCGGSGSNYSLKLGWQRYESRSINTLLAEQRGYVSKFGYDELDSSSSSGSEPDGMYTEGTYKPGHCVLCGRHREKVWHKADGGCDCCTTCERTH